MFEKDNKKREEEDKGKREWENEVSSSFNDINALFTNGTNLSCYQIPEFPLITARAHLWN
jgi:hypothetical protein